MSESAKIVSFKRDFSQESVQVMNVDGEAEPRVRLPFGPQPPDNDLMEARVTKLEEFAVETREKLGRIETKLDSTATKADLMEAINGQIKWMVATAVVLGGTAITVMTFVLNNATPKTAPPVPQPAAVNPPAIIINNLPPTPATALAAPAAVGPKKP